MNKKGQGAIEILFLYLIFIIFYFAWLGEWLATVSALVMATGNFTGVEAFFYSNLNLWVFLGCTFGLFGWAAWVGE